MSSHAIDLVHAHYSRKVGKWGKGIWVPSSSLMERLTDHNRTKIIYTIYCYYTVLFCEIAGSTVNPCVDNYVWVQHGSDEGGRWRGRCWTVVQLGQHEYDARDALYRHCAMGLRRTTCLPWTKILHGKISYVLVLQLIAYMTRIGKVCCVSRWLSAYQSLIQSERFYYDVIKKLTISQFSPTHILRGYDPPPRSWRQQPPKFTPSLPS